MGGVKEVQAGGASGSAGQGGVADAGLDIIVPDVKVDDLKECDAEIVEGVCEAHCKSDGSINAFIKDAGACVIDGNGYVVNLSNEGIGVVECVIDNEVGNVTAFVEGRLWTVALKSVSISSHFIVMERDEFVVDLAVAGFYNGYSPANSMNGNDWEEFGLMTEGRGVEGEKFFDFYARPVGELRDGKIEWVEVGVGAMSQYTMDVYANGDAVLGEVVPGQSINVNVLNGKVAGVTNVIPDVDKDFDDGNCNCSVPGGKSEESSDGLGGVIVGLGILAIGFLRRKKGKDENEVL